MAVQAKPVIRKGEAFILQLLSNGGYDVFTPDASAITITFPDLSVLTLYSGLYALSANYLEIGDISTTLSSYYATNLLTDLQKWGFDTDSTDKILHISVDDLKDATYSALFSYVDADGVTIDFDEDTFMDGAYKVEIDGTIYPVVTAGSFVVGNTYQIVTPGTTDFTLIGAVDMVVGRGFTANGVGTGTGTAVLVVDYTGRILTTANADAYLSENINTYLELKEDETAYKQDLNNLKDLVEKLLIIQYALRYDFTHGYYTAANEKATALKTIEDTGEYIFKPGH